MARPVPGERRMPQQLRHKGKQDDTREICAQQVDCTANVWHVKLVALGFLSGQTNTDVLPASASFYLISEVLVDTTMTDDYETTSNQTGHGYPVFYLCPVAMYAPVVEGTGPITGSSMLGAINRRSPVQGRKHACSFS